MTNDTGAQPDASQVCALPGCDEVIVQPEGGGRRRRYCSDAHRSLANRHRSAPSSAQDRADRLRAARELLDELGAADTHDPDTAVALAKVRAQAAAEVATARQEALDAAREAAEARTTAEAVREEAVEAVQRCDAARTLAEQVATELRVALDQAHASLSAAEAAHQADMATLRNDATAAARAHEVEVDRLEETVAAERRRADSADAQRDGAERRAAEVTARLGEAERRDSQLEAQLGDVTGRATLLSDQMAALEGLLGEERARAAGLASERDRLAATLTDDQAAADELRASLEELGRKAVVDETVRATAEARADRFEQEARDLAVALARARQELADFHQAVGAATDAVDQSDSPAAS